MAKGMKNRDRIQLVAMAVDGGRYDDAGMTIVCRTEWMNEPFVLDILASPSAGERALE